MSSSSTLTFEQLLVVLDAVRSVGCSFWLEGGWGVDALVGHQTRPHRDVGLDIDGTYERDVLGDHGDARQAVSGGGQLDPSG